MPYEGGKPICQYWMSGRGGGVKISENFADIISGWYRHKYSYSSCSKKKSRIIEIVVTIMLAVCFSWKEALKLLRYLNMLLDCELRQH